MLLWLGGKGAHARLRRHCNLKQRREIRPAAQGSVGRAVQQNMLGRFRLRVASGAGARPLRVVGGAGGKRRRAATQAHERHLGPVAAWWAGPRGVWLGGHSISHALAAHSVWLRRVKSPHGWSLAVRVAGRDRVAVLGRAPPGGGLSLRALCLFGSSATPFHGPCFCGGYLRCGLLAVLSSRTAHARAWGRARAAPSVFCLTLPGVLQLLPSAGHLAWTRMRRPFGGYAWSSGAVALTCLLSGSEIRSPFEARRACCG